MKDRLFTEGFEYFNETHLLMSSGLNSASSLVLLELVDYPSY
jgi:hypothetical protein